MGKGNQANALLVEIMIAVLFFALAATVILDCFSTAHSQSVRVGRQDEALRAAQDLAEQIYAGEEPETLLVEAGYAFSNGLWHSPDGEWRLAVAFREEDGECGVFRAAEVRVLTDDGMVVSLPCSRYVPGEVAP